MSFQKARIPDEAISESQVLTQLSKKSEALRINVFSLRCPHLVRDEGPVAYSQVQTLNNGVLIHGVNCVFLSKVFKIYRTIHSYNICVFRQYGCQEK